MLHNFADAQRLLIKPFERLRFVTVFILATSLSQVVARFVFSQPSFDLLWKRSQIQYGIATGIIAGLFAGAVQWLILRKYVSDWNWILVVGLSTTFVTSIQIALDMWRESLLSSANGLSGQEISQIVLVALIFSIGSVFMSGYLQWYVLRPYVAEARWWILIPFIAVLVGGIPLLLGFLTRGLLRFNVDILTLTILPTTQAIGFCLLKKKSVSEHPILQTPLALATDIVNYWDIQNLREKLHVKISQIWATDLEKSIGQLSYLVGVNRGSAIIAYEPLNQNSADNVNQVPLHKLASDPSSADLTTKAATSFAKFLVIFTPSSTVQIYSWRGVPLIWLGVAVYSGVIGLSILSAWLHA